MVWALLCLLRFESYYVALYWQSLLLTVLLNIALLARLTTVGLFNHLIILPSPCELRREGCARYFRECRMSWTVRIESFVVNSKVLFWTALWRFVLIQLHRAMCLCVELCWRYGTLLNCNGVNFVVNAKQCFVLYWEKKSLANKRVCTQNYNREHTLSKSSFVFEMSCKLHHPFTALLSGPTGCGKSAWVLRLVDNAMEMIEPPSVKYTIATVNFNRCSTIIHE